MAGGQSDNDKRQPLWRHGGYNRTAPLYRWTTALVAARKRMLSGTTADTIDTVTNLHSEDSYLSFERGGAVVVLAAVVDPATHRENGVVTVTLQTSLPSKATACDALLDPATSLSAGSEECAAAEGRLCGAAQQQGRQACEACAGTHMVELVRAGCTDADTKSFCAGSAPSPSPAPAPAGCAPHEARIDCNSQSFTNESVCVSHNCCWDTTSTPCKGRPECNCFEKGGGSGPPPPPPQPVGPPPPPAPPLTRCYQTGEGGRLAVELHALPRVFFAQKSSLTAKLDDQTGITATAARKEEEGGLFYNGVDLSYVAQAEAQGFQFRASSDAEPSDP
eukprot:COSAG04_NODE_6689_length_1277_cov_1.111205_1_plen_333_part_10